MVSNSKIIQPSHRFIQLILLCQFWQLGFASPGWPEYSSIRILAEDRGEIFLFLINVGVTLIGNKLDKGYKCPVYCDVDHNHIYWENYEKAESNIPSDDGLPGSDEYEDREQQKDNIRPVASID